MLPLYLSREYIEPFQISKGALQIHPNAVDIINPSNGISIQYENLCFSFLQTQAQDSLVIGPHLVDFMIGRNPSLGGVVRPDAILLTMQDKQAILTGMAEFKSGNGIGYNNKFDNKLAGFEKLLEKFREIPTLLPEMLFYAVGEHVDTPTNIVVPPDEEIEITFLSPFRHGVLYDASAAAFPVTYFRVPLPEQIAA
jgi:hypothetical protein